jgi:beta-glucuronidase
VVRVYLHHPDVVGVAIWQFCDVRVTRNWWGHRPRTMNNKGVVDEFRRPKLSYEVVKKRMCEARRKRRK